MIPHLILLSSTLDNGRHFFGPLWNAPGVKSLGTLHMEAGRLEGYENITVIVAPDVRLTQEALDSLNRCSNIHLHIL
jgi:hypothetical protein